jgi:hypothetical protein
MNEVDRGCKPDAMQNLTKALANHIPEKAAVNAIGNPMSGPAARKDNPIR